MIGCRDVEVAREAGASVMGSGVAMCGDCGWSGAWDGVSRKLFCVAGVDCRGGSDAGGCLLEATVCGGGACGNCRNGVGVCENCE